MIKGSFNNIKLCLEYFPAIANVETTEREQIMFYGRYSDREFLQENVYYHTKFSSRSDLSNLKDFCSTPTSDADMNSYPDMLIYDTGFRDDDYNSIDRADDSIRVRF